MKADKFILFSVLLLLIVNVSAITIDQIFPTISPYTSHNAFETLQFNFSGSVNNVTFNWNGSNTTLYDSSLVLMYNFDNRSALGENNTKVVDLSMYGNNGTVVGGSNMTWTANGKYGGAFNFSGNLSYINVPQSSSINITNSVTLSVWFKWTNDNTQSYPKLVRKNANYELYLLNSTGTVQFSYKNLTNTNDIQGSTTNVNDSLWHNVILSYDSTSNSLMYLDGVLESNISARGNINSTSSALLIGNSFPSFFMNGSIDDVMIWNRSLTVSEINQLYHTQHTKYDAQNHSVSFNQSIKGIAIPYQLFISNSTNTINSNLNSISRISTITSNFTNSIGIIRSNFYGTNINVARWFGGCTKIDLDGDGTRETCNDLNFARTNYLNSNMNYIRSDMSLGNYYSNQTTRTNGVNLTGDLSNHTGLVQWAYANNIKILYEIDFMPTWLADNSSGKCIDKSFCYPLNYTIYNNVVLDFINNVTNNGQYINNIELEFWNEPYGSFFIGGLADDNINKASNYTYFYNSTYNRIKQVYPTIPFGGPSGYRDAPNMTKYFLSNASTLGYSWDFLSIHPYDSGSITSNNLRQLSDVQNLYINCTTYGVSCNRIILSEWSVSFTPNTNTSSLSQLYSSIFAHSYLSILNNYPANITMVQYAWSNPFGYSNSAYYESYPNIYSMVSEAGLDNPTATYYTPYNITKNFATYLSANTNIFSTSSDDSDLKSSCGITPENKYNCIIINTNGVDSKNAVINTQTLPATKLINYQTGQEYTVTSGLANIGNLDPYEIVYLYAETSQVLNYSSRFRFNENTGIIVYDTLGSTGVLSDATWNRSTENRTLVENIDYILDKTLGLLTLNLNYVYSYLSVSTNYTYDENTLATDVSDNTNNAIAGTIDWFDIFIIISAMVVLIFLVIIIIKSISNSGMTTNQSINSVGTA